MKKKDLYTEKLLPLLKDETGGEKLEQILISGSNLPGKRANIELAYALADCWEREDIREDHWKMLFRWAGISGQAAPLNHPREFLPFCALLSLGSAYHKGVEKRREKIIHTLKYSASDGRWRIREAVAMGFQRIAKKDFLLVKKILSEWIKKASLTEKRAILATLAHPPLLGRKKTVSFCLRLADEILQDLPEIRRSERKEEEFNILKKGLEFTLSVYVSFSPEEGFAFLKKWAQRDDEDIRKIIKSNLSKARLSKHHEQRVREVASFLHVGDKTREKNRP